jgi:Right handed beta helix region
MADELAGAPRRRRFPILLSVLAVGALLLPSPWIGEAMATGTDLARWSQPIAPANCAAPNVVCMTGDSTSRIDVTTSDRIYDGRGFSSVGITVNASNVTIQNFNFTNCASHCVWVKGTGNVVQDNTISQVYYDGDDIDGLRFFGNGTRILRNTFTNILKGDKEDAHLDCMQTWASSSTGGGSSNVQIEANHCNDGNFHQCLMVEGPGSTDGGGGGDGVTSDWMVAGNFFACHANQTIALRDVHNTIIRDNNFAGSGRKAIQQADGTSGIRIRDNILGPGYGRLTGD